MSIIGIAQTSGNGAEILCKSLALVAAANDGNAMVLRIVEPTAFELPFSWQDVGVAQCLRKNEAQGPRLEKTIVKARRFRTMLLECPIDLFASVPALWQAVDLLLIPVLPCQATLQVALPFLVQLQKLEGLGNQRHGKTRLLDASASPGHPKRLLQPLGLAAKELDAELQIDLIQVLVSAYRAPHWSELDDILGLRPSLPGNAAIEGIKDLWHAVESAIHRQEKPRQRPQRVADTEKKYRSAEALIDLAEDVRLIDYGLGPTDDDLAAASGLKDWQVRDDGLVEGQLVSPSGDELGKLLPREVVRSDPLGRWIRTPDKLLRLLAPAYPSATQI